MALSFNFDKNKSEWKKVNEIIRHKTKKKIFRVSQKFGETIVTEDHSIYTDGASGIKLSTPEEVKGRKLIKLKEIPKTKQLQEIDLFEFLKNYSYSFKYKGIEKKAGIKKDNEFIWF